MAEQPVYGVHKSRLLWGGEGNLGRYVTNPDGSLSLEDVLGTSAADRDVEHYRTAGARTRAPVALDQSQADGARAMQLGSLGMLERAAAGGAPSQAQHLGQLEMSNAMQGQMGAAAGARGVGSQIAAMRGATSAAGGQMAGVNSQTMGMRAKEAETDRGALLGAASAMRGHDIAAATENAKLEAQGRAQDEARRQAFERFGWNTRNAQLQGGVEQDRQFKQEVAANKALAAQKTASDVGIGMSAASAGLGLISDERAKKNVTPMGSLARYETGDFR